MRRTLVFLTALVGLLGLTVAAPWQAKAAPTAPAAPSAVAHTATCAFTSYTLTGSFTRLSSNDSFNLHAVGSCVGTSSSVVVDLGFSSVGPWSCAGGLASGGGVFTPNNGSNEVVDARLVNVGGEYIVEINNTASFAAGQFTTLPVSCELGGTETTIGGSGTLTFTA